ncbi:MAG: GNAT family N-acetyltransferase [Janthinobacterium lividum]
MSVIIRAITAEQTWPMRLAVMYPAFSIDQVKLKDDATGRHFGLFLGEELIVVVSVFVQDEGLQFRKLATKTDQQGKGYGRQMMQFILNLASAENLKLVCCNARLSAAAFYKQFDFEISGETWQQDGHEFVIMQKQILG